VHDRVARLDETQLAVPRIYANRSGRIASMRAADGARR
jgi:hypothetical protein